MVLKEGQVQKTRGAEKAQILSKRTLKSALELGSKSSNNKLPLRVLECPICWAKVSVAWLALPAESPALYHQSISTEGQPKVDSQCGLMSLAFKMYHKACLAFGDISFKSSIQFMNVPLTECFLLMLREGMKVIMVNVGQ